jgi:hypothetical protein
MKNQIASLVLLLSWTWIGVGLTPLRAAHDAMPEACIHAGAVKEIRLDKGQRSWKKWLAKAKAVRMATELLTPHMLHALHRAAMEPSVRTWTFIHKKHKYETLLKTGDLLTIQHHHQGFRRKDKGTLDIIDQDSVYIINDMGYRHAYAREHILEIKRHKKMSTALKGLSVLLIIAGIVLLVLTFLAMLVMFVLFPFSNQEEGGGCTVGLLLLLVAPLLFLLGMPRTITEPFGDRWQVVDSHPAELPVHAEPIYEMP